MVAGAAVVVGGASVVGSAVVDGSALVVLISVVEPVLSFSL